MDITFPLSSPGEIYYYIQSFFIYKYIGRIKKLLLVVIFFENKLLLQPDVVFDSESNGRNFNSLAPPGGEKIIILNFFFKMTSEKIFD